MGYEEMVSNLPEGIPVLLLTKNAALLPFSEAVTKLMMPFRGEELIGAIRSLMPVQPHKKPRKPMRSPEEQRKIDNAKQLLMQQRTLTEPEAFRYLQKTSMDTGRTLLETAEMVLYVYGGQNN